MANEAGKGDRYRKVDQKKYSKNYDKIFGDKAVGRHLSNIFDHRKHNSRMMFSHSYNAFICGEGAMDKEWQHYVEWIDRNVIGPPKATESYTVAQLEEMGMIGIYAREKE